MQRRIALFATFFSVLVLVFMQSAPTRVQAQIDFPVSSFNINCGGFQVTGNFSDGLKLAGTTTEHTGNKYPGLTAFVDINGNGVFNLPGEVFVKNIGGGSPSGSYADTITWPNVPEGTFVYVDLSSYVAPYTDFSQYNSIDFGGNWDNENYVFGGFLCFNDPATIITGPPLPPGSELKTITCDVAVYDSAGGRPVGSNRIKAGQTWYVMPGVKTASGPGGTGSIEWSEVFVGGYTNGWIPTSCVQNPNRGEAEATTTGGGGGGAGAGGSVRVNVPDQNPAGGGDAFVRVPFSFGLGQGTGPRDAILAKVRR
jgi:hypothetical protein